MSDQSDDVDQGGGVPDSDPDHIDPAGDLADLLEDQLASAELGPADPALEAQVRIARSILEAIDGGGGDI